MPTVKVVSEWLSKQGNAMDTGVKHVDLQISYGQGKMGVGGASGMIDG